MSNPYVHLNIRKDTKEMLKQVKEVYLMHHPEMRGIPLGNDFLVKKAFEFYIDG